MNELRRPLLPLCLLLCCAAGARADVVTLQNGVTLEGVLAKEEDGTAILQVAVDGYVVLDTATVTDMRTQSAAENARLKARWAEEDAREAARERERLRFAATQRAKGLIPYRDDWVTPAEFDRRLALEELAVRREYGARTTAPPVQIVVNEESDGLYLYTTLGRAARFKKRGTSFNNSPAPMAEFSSSGNFIRPSEFVRRGVHGNSHYFDPSTGLYR